MCMISYDPYFCDTQLIAEFRYPIFYVGLKVAIFAPSTCHALIYRHAVEAHAAPG